MASRQPPSAGVPCPIGRAVDVLGDRWSLLILRNAIIGVTRFDQFRADLGIADNILSNRLNRLVESGLLTKVPYRDEGRTRHEYRLTDAGADLLPILHALARWGQQHTSPAEPTGAMQVVHLACGHATTAGDQCDHCGRSLVRDELAWVRPWQSDDPIRLAEPVT